MLIKNPELYPEINIKIDALLDARKKLDKDFCDYRINYKEKRLQINEEISQLKNTIGEKRYNEILEHVSNGTPRREISEMYGLSVQRVAQLQAQAARRKKNEEKNKGFYMLSGGTRNVLLRHEIRTLEELSSMLESEEGMTRLSSINGIGEGRMREIMRAVRKEMP